MTSKFSRFGSRQFFASGKQVDPKKLAEFSPINFTDFSGGYNTGNSELNSPVNVNFGGLDGEVSKDNCFIRAPGVEPLESLSHSIKQLITHPSLSSRSDLLLLAPPYLGLRTSASTFWIYETLDIRAPFFWALYGDLLLFANGYKRYKHVAGENLITEITDIPNSQSMAVWAGRLWQGAATIGSNFEPMGLQWSGINDYNDNDPATGYGFEFLEQDSGFSDSIVALKPMNFDQMAVLCRNSLWTAKRTGDLFEPATIEPRLVGKGCINQRTAHVTTDGVIYLSDEGLEIFDGSNSYHISSQIDLEINDAIKLRPDSIWGRFNSNTQKYYLGVKDQGTYVLDVLTKRWSHRTVEAADAASFARQLPSTTWADIVGTWGEQTLQWKDFARTEAKQFDMMMVGPSATAATILGRENYGYRWNFDELHLQFPTHVVPSRVDAAAMNMMFQVNQVSILYKGGGSVGIYLTDKRLVEGLIGVIPLPPVDNFTIVAHAFNASCIGMGLSLQMLEGELSIKAASVLAREIGVRVDLPPL